MKIRNDFVTNSSSSSFIIGKKDEETVTLEYVFQTVRNFYKEYLSKRDAIVQYINDNPKLGIVYEKTKDDDYYHFRFLDGKRWDEKNSAINKEIERHFGISTWECFEENYDWLKCKTYKEYEKYWIRKMSESNNYRVHAPFTIVDFFEEKEIYWLHYKGDKTVNHVNSKSNILNWYYEYIEDAFKCKDSCAECDNIEWCNREKCEKQKQLLKNGTIPEDKACLYLLGRICIHSECGYIPKYVVEKLEKISEYSCNHMG